MREAMCTETLSRARIVTKPMNRAGKAPATESDLVERRKIELHL